jgi:hypothetical protein
MTYTIPQLWQLACQYDGIAPESKFVVFSQDNPFARKYNFAMLCARLAAGSETGAN